MRGVETRIQEIRHKIFTEVARMAYHTEWPVKDRMEALPYKIIPGEKGNFRNDVFLERAIVGERLRLARLLVMQSLPDCWRHMAIRWASLRSRTGRMMLLFPCLAFQDLAFWFLPEIWILW